MIPVALRFSSSFLLAVLASAGLSMAGDIIKLKSGEKYDGKILSETATEVAIEIQVGRIKETKKVARKDIAELVKATPDQIESAALAKLIPSKDMMSDAEYQSILTEKLEPFLKKYPTSPHKGAVEAIIKTYKEEMVQAKSGAKKLEGVWISPAELDWNAYNFEARLRRVELEKLLQAGKPEAAYRILAELEASKPASVETVKSFELFKNALPAFESTLDRMVLEHPVKLKIRTDSVKTLSADEKKLFDEGIKKEEADLKLRLEEDKKMKLGILAFNEYDLKSLTDAKAAFVKEAARINKLDLNGMKVAATAFQTGLKNFSEKSYLSAQKNFEDAAKAFPKDTFVKERADLAKKAAAEAARANAEATAAKPVPVADAAAKTADGKPAPGKTSEPAKTAGGAPVKKAPAPAATPDETATDEAGEPEAASNLPMFLIAGAALLLITLLVVKMLAKKKAAASDE